MQHLQAIPEAEMVAIFLQAELASPRYGPIIRTILERDGRGREIIEVPDLANAAHNRIRAQVLGEYRGYRRNADVFAGIPPDVRWFRALATKNDLEKARYIDYDYWTELSGGSRLAVAAAERIKQGIKVFGVSNDSFLHIADALRAGASFPELILVGPDERGPLTLLEGHTRLTGYFIASESIPPLLPVIVGYAPGLECM